MGGLGELRCHRAVALGCSLEGHGQWGCVDWKPPPSFHAASAPVGGGVALAFLSPLASLLDYIKVISEC